MASHFERAIVAAQRETADRMLAIPNGDSHKHAELKGVFQGLGQALDIFKKAARSDLGETD